MHRYTGPPSKVKSSVTKNSRRSSLAQRALGSHAANQRTHPIKLKSFVQTSRAAPTTNAEPTPKPAPSSKTVTLIGNTTAWKDASAWSLGRRKGEGPFVLILRGPHGIGKTTGARELAQQGGWSALVELAASDDDVAGSLDVDVERAMTRAGWDDEDLGRLVLVDDLEGFATEDVKRLTTRLRDLKSACSGVIITVGMAMKLPEAFKDDTFAKIIRLNALTGSDLLLLSQKQRTKVPPAQVQRAVLAAAGDARRFLKELELLELTQLPCTLKARQRVPVDSFSAARRLLFGARLSMQDATEIFHREPPALMQGLIGANYLQAASNGVMNSLSSVSSVAELLSCADSMRCAPAYELTACAETLLASSLLTHGNKLARPDDAKIMMPQKMTRSQKFQDFP